jgi:hypothetical protein
LSSARYPLRPSSKDRVDILCTADVDGRVDGDEHKEPSAKVARRLGMRQGARLVHNEIFKGERSTELDYAMLAEEWPAPGVGGQR